MIDRKKVIKGLECCSKGDCADCDNCTYHAVQTDVPCESTLMRDALALLKAREAKGKAYWTPCQGKSHIWYCSACGEKINYNDARRTYQKEKKPIESVNKFCRSCGAQMTSRPTDEVRRATPWE